MCTRTALLLGCRTAGHCPALRAARTSRLLVVRSVLAALGCGGTLGQQRCCACCAAGRHRVKVKAEEIVAWHRRLLASPLLLLLLRGGGRGGGSGRQQDGAQLAHALGGVQQVHA